VPVDSISIIALRSRAVTLSDSGRSQRKANVVGKALTSQSSQQFRGVLISIRNGCGSDTLVEMSRYYFDFRDNGHSVPDAAGTEFVSFEEAKAEACKACRILPRTCFPAQ
jgi:hypothetical protein